MNKLPVILPILLLFSSSVAADFSNSQISLHPELPGGDPFIIEISGIWPDDCHPGEQKPVVAGYNGQTVEIEYEIIIFHVTCNIVDTAYRSLVDMSDVLGMSTRPIANRLDIRVEYAGATLEQTVDLVCPDTGACVPPPQPKTESGVYAAPGLANQGLLVERQHAAMAIYPLVYDEEGRAQWLFSGNRVSGDTFFAEVLQLSGGDCFGCLPEGNQPDMTPVGHLSVLLDRPGVLQVKVNDGLFTEYQKLVFGYKTFPVGANGEQTIVDLEGRWGITENQGTNPPLGDLTEFFPGAFEIKRDQFVPADQATAVIGQVSYQVASVTGETLGDLVCMGTVALDGATNICEFYDPADPAEPLFLFLLDGPSSLSLEYAQPVQEIAGYPPGGKAIRLD